MPDLITKILQRGGEVTWIIFALGTFALVIVIARILHFHRAHINVPEFMRGVMNVLRRGNVLEAVSICDETPGPVAHVLRTAILNCGKGEARMRQAVQDSSLAEIPRLEKWVRGLAGIAAISILLGLLGTVIGIIRLFEAMSNAGTFVDVPSLAGGIWMALISTATGMVVAIGANASYNYFVARIDNILLDMEKAAAEMIHFLIENDIRIENNGEDGNDNAAKVEAEVADV